jgi:hypothetical protein
MGFTQATLIRQKHFSFSPLTPHVDDAADAAEKRGEHRPPPPPITIAITAIVIANGLAIGLAISTRSVTVGAIWLGACVCFASAIALAGPIQYQKWLSSQRRKNGQRPHCGFDLRHSPRHCPECGSGVCDTDRKHMTVTFTATEAGAVSESTFTKIWLASATPQTHS